MSHLPVLPVGTLSVISKPPRKTRPRHVKGISARRAKEAYNLLTSEHIARRKVEGASFEEIARELGLSRATIQQKYRDAHKRRIMMLPYEEAERERAEEHERLRPPPPPPPPYE